MQSLLFLQEKIWICLSQHISSQLVAGAAELVWFDWLPGLPNTTRAKGPPPPQPAPKLVWQAASAVNLSREDVRVMWQWVTIARGVIGESTGQLSNKPGGRRQDICAGSGENSEVSALLRSSHTICRHLMDWNLSCHLFLSPFGWQGHRDSEGLL